jgi:hypothetical protein
VGEEGKLKDSIFKFSSRNKPLWLSLKPEENEVISGIFKGKRRKVL